MDADVEPEQGFGPVELLNLRFAEAFSQKQVEALESPSRRQILRALGGNLIGPGPAPTAEAILHLADLQSLAVVNFHLQLLLRADFVVRGGRIDGVSRIGSWELGYHSAVRSDNRVWLILKTTELLDGRIKC